jgi:CRISPR-associated protein Cas5h
MVERRQFVRFDVAGDLAHFRRPYASTTALTFPLPTRTALCGLVGALLGLPKNDGLSVLTDDLAIFSVELRGRLKTDSISLNLIDTKDNPTFRLKPENPHTIVRYEVIKEPRYRIWFGHSELSQRLYELLEGGHAHYTPCLGLAWMICWLDGNPDMVEAEGPYPEPVANTFSPTLVRSDSIIGEIDWDDDSMYQRVRMPAEMRPDRTVTRYQEYIIETSGRPVRAVAKNCWRLADGTVISPM